MSLPTIYIATDHSGFELKEILREFLSSELGYTVEDCGAVSLDSTDDYPDFVHAAAAAVAEDPGTRRGIVIGASGQGEAMVANRYAGVRAAVYYGAPAKEQTDATGATLDMIESTRQHNDANVLSLGARFLEITAAKEAVRKWLETSFTAEERHVRRIQKIEETQ
ncbi:RpiB/LacA/LacB family sugar-phosphate isomerase [Candidatus Kaiserbacteria bacterium]|nr:RpiB/LacA/LacB family sugar-phosphate isomerase [Candidatus Kaiserbacteria bacterium]MCB9811716.1 RpiB/LacA/LacB family sugar-phosphate isomerase [Candidatus Nomurabacteria bacterium]